MPSKLAGWSAKGGLGGLVAPRYRARSAAAKAGHIEVMRQLVAARADPDPLDQDGWTVILMADIYPIEKTSMLKYELTLAAGRTVKVLPTDLR